MEVDLSEKLREENTNLLAQLKTGVLQLRHVVNDAEKKAALQIEKHQGKIEKSRAVKKILEKSKPKTFRPVEKNSLPKPDLHGKDNKMPARKKFSARNLAKTSTPMHNVDTSQSKELHSLVLEPRTPQNLPKSILVTPDTRKLKKKTPKQAKPKVTFPSKISEKTSFQPEEQISQREKSFLGYDWIAGALDNDSTVTEQSDLFFEELKEFRRVNRDECISKETPFKSVEDYTPKSQTKAKKFHNKENDRKQDICCGSTYTINGRLFPVPIHGPYSQCPVCKTKEEPETEYDRSYIRVSVPRSTLQSPYKIKPHRRKSFDPSDSVALSEHCLAGWQSARPAYAPGPDTLDLKSSVQTETGLSALGGTRNPRTGYQRETEELLNTTIGMRHGLQLLEQRYDGERRANSTSYPTF